MESFSAITVLLAAVIFFIIGLMFGWLWAVRSAGTLRSERDRYRDQIKSAATDLENEVTRYESACDQYENRLETATDDLKNESERRQETERKFARLTGEHDAREQAFTQQMEQLKGAQTALTAQFREVGQMVLGDAQKAFLERADARFKQSETSAGIKLESLLKPVSDRLKDYEAAVGKVEKERRGAFDELHGQITAMHSQSERISSEAAKLVNALRNAPKARGRWGEQQLRNVLENCGLSEYADFQTEVSVEDSDGKRLRPDVVIKVPGGQSLVIDAKVSLNAYQDAFGAEDEAEKNAHLTAHANSMKTHVNTLGKKDYWNQFDNTPDFVVMFVPGEHFLAAALEHDAELWDYAFDKRVLLATPTNLIAIARTVAAVWRQEKLAGQSREIAALGKELYARMRTMGTHIARVGQSLDRAVGNYNAFVGSFESQVLTQAKRFETLDIETGDKLITALPVVEQAARPLTKLTSDTRDLASASDRIARLSARLPDAEKAPE